MMRGQSRACHHRVAEALHGLRASGVGLVVSAFGRDGDGGLGVITEAGIDVLDRVSSKGIASDGAQVFRVLDTSGGVRTWARGGVVLVHGEDGAVRADCIDGVGDVHDLLIDDDTVLLVSTANDSILRLREVGGALSSVELVYSSGHGCDHTHVNCVAIADGRLVATAFAPEEGWSWRTNLRKMRRGEGRLFDVRTGEVLIDRLSRPHSPRRWNDSWVIAEAGAHSVLIAADTGERVSIDVGGFARGLHLVGDLAFVAISPSRPSTNAIAAGPQTNDDSSAGIVVVDLASAEIVDRIDLPFAEVYDIATLPLEAIESIARCPGERLRDLVEGSGVGASMDTSVDLADREARIDAEAPDSAPGGVTISVPVEVVNLGGRTLVSSGAHRVLLGWWWGDRPEGLRGGTGLGRPLAPGQHLHVQCQVETPTRPGVHRLTVGLIQEGVGWFAGAASFEVSIAPGGSV